ncbi:tetratricopeptide repeat protein, partial [Amycolatopsis kentuckyensis]|uniref:tetratricopeptide repeat protein n=1 Tax=Amycolatopsis kentuckyensis TaxID=218823 RepID=UPI0035615550
LAMSINNLANRLSDAGRRPEALAAAQEAVEFYRELARIDPNRFGLRAERASELVASLAEE